MRAGRTTWLAAGAAAGLLVGGGGVAVATTASTSTAITACVGPDGVMRMPQALEESAQSRTGGAQIAAPTGTTCPFEHRAVSWNAAGPQGPVGPAGPQGPKGEKGDPGDSYGKTYYAYRSQFSSDGNPVEVVRIPEVPAGDYSIQVSANAVQLNGVAYAGSCTVHTPTGLTSHPSQAGFDAAPTTSANIAFFVTAKLSAPGPVTLRCMAVSEKLGIGYYGRLMATSVPEFVASPFPTPSATWSPAPSPQPTVTPSAPSPAVTPSR